MNECAIDGCGSARVAKGLCQKHYMRKRRTGSAVGPRVNAAKQCVIEGCTRNATVYGYCHSHKNRSTEYAERREAKKKREREGRVCLQCAAPLPSEKNLRAIYCSTKCKTKHRIAGGRASEAALRSYFKRRYGLTPEQVETMAAAGCAICGTTVWNGRHARPHVDHDHATGKVRGILCSECNTGLGKFRDDPELIRRALAYLSDHTP